VPKKKRLHVLCAVDADIAGQVRRRRRRWNRAKWDGAVVDSLRRQFTRVDVVGVDNDSVASWRAFEGTGADVVFNLALSALSSEAAFIGFLQSAGLRSTGSGVLALALSNDKIRSRTLLAAAGVRVPRFVALLPGVNPRGIDLKPPVIVKPACQASAEGLSRDSVVMTRREALDRARRIWRRFGEPAVCDEFIPGREFRAGFVEGPRKRVRVAGVSELLFVGGHHGLRTESKRHRSRRIRLPPGRRTEMTAIAQAAFDTLGLRGYASLDLRLDSFDRFTVLEVNANPGLSSDSHVWGGGGGRFDLHIRVIVEAALRG
jgi:D-alanine-D-alanine ligase